MAAFAIRGRELVIYVPRKENSDQTNFRTDLTGNGIINSSDIGAVKAASGQIVAPAPEAR